MRKTTSIVLIFLVSIISCSSNPPIHRLIVPENLISVYVVGKVTVGEITSRIPDTYTTVDLVGLLRKALNAELSKRDLLAEDSFYVVSADITGYSFRSEDEINKGPIIGWAIPSLPIAIFGESIGWAILPLSASALSYFLDNWTKVGSFAMVVNVTVYERKKVLLSENITVDIAQENIDPESVVVEKMAGVIAEKIASALR